MSSSAMDVDVDVDVDETDKANRSGTHQAQNSMDYAKQAFLTTLPEPWKTIASEAIPSSGESLSSSSSSSSSYPTASIRLEQLEMSSRSNLLKLLMVDENTNNNNKAHSIGTTWRTALDMCHHMVHFANLHKQKQQKELEERKTEQEGKEEETKSSEETETTAPEATSYSSPYLDMEPRKLPLILLEDCIDGLTLKESQSLWMDHVEPSLSPILLGDLFWKSSKVCHLQFLKVCNQLLHRIQGSSAHYEWKGSILLTQAKAFGIADRSAIKVWGSFRGGSSKELDDEDAHGFESFDEFVADKLEEPQGEKEYSLYKAFWSLQKDFSNPNSIQIGDFIKKMKLVLEAMESVSQSNKDKSSDDSTNPLSTSESYLTSSILFLTQLEQTEFQSQFLSQFIIVTNHLSAESPSLANALKTLYQRSKDLLKIASPAVYHLLCDHLLVQSEVHWRKWKKEQRCAAAAFATPKRLMETIGVLETGEWDEHTKKRLQLVKEAMKGMPRKSAANKQTARQTKQTADDEWIQQFAPVSKEEVMVACVKLGSFEPTLEEHMEDCIDAFDPDAGIEEEYHPKNDPQFAWRAMRLFAKHQLALLKLCKKPKHLEAMARQWHKDTTGKDLPGQMPDSEASEGEGEDDTKSETGDKPKEQEEKEVEDEEDSEKEEDASTTGDDEDSDEGEEKETEIEDVKMEDKDDVKAESVGKEASEDVPMDEEKDEEPSMTTNEIQDIKQEEAAKETSESKAAVAADAEKDVVTEETEDIQGATTNEPEVTEEKEDADKKDDKEEAESDPKETTASPDAAKEAAKDEDAALTKIKAVKQEKEDDTKIVKKEETETAKEETETKFRDASEDRGSQRGSSKDSSEKEEKGNNRANQNSSSNRTMDTNSSKRKHPGKDFGGRNSNEREDHSKRPRDDNERSSNGDRRSRTTSEERPGSSRDTNNDNSGRGGRDLHRSDNRGGGGRSRSGGRYDDRGHGIDQRRRDGRGDGKHDDGQRGGGNGRDGGRDSGRDGGRDGGRNGGRGRQGGDRFNDGPRGGRHGGGGDRNEEKPRGGDRGRDDRFDNSGPPRGGVRRDDRGNDDGPRGGRGGGGPRGGGGSGPRNSSGGSGERRFDGRRPADDRNRRRGRGGGGG
ncbi:MAG: hypothetical protein SGBAC_002679, partial [Bacillariaceae sp.]